MNTNKTQRKRKINRSKSLKRTGGMTIPSRKFSHKLRKYSSPEQAQKMAYKYLGKTAKIYPSSNPEKKYQIWDPKNEKWVYFGQIGYEDYTKHHDKDRRHNYLTRTAGMLGDWKSNKYSANNLSRNILW
jgi:hypothetical protein